MITGLIFILLGILSIVISVISYKEYNRVIPIHISNTSDKSFNINAKSDYAICVEGINHGQITQDMITLIDTKNNIHIELKPIEHLKLTNRYQQKFYHNIFKFSINNPCAVKIIIPTYKSLKTHHSRYKIVEKYSIAKPPIILVHRFYSIAQRLRYIPFLIGFMFLMPIGIFLIFKS